MRRRAVRVGAVLSFVWLACVVLHTVLSGRWWPMLLPDLAPPLLLVAVPVLLGVPAVLGVVGARRDPRRWAPVAAGVASLALGAGQSGLNVDAFGRGSAPVPAGALHVVAWNTQYWDQDEDPGAFYAYLHAFDADVYLLQEYLNWNDDTPVRLDDTARLHAEFPGYSIATDGELLTLSRLPITASRALDNTRWYASTPAGSDFPEFWRAKTLRTDIRAGDQVVSLYNAHIPVQLDTSSGVFTPAFLGKVRTQAERRSAAWAALTDDLAGNPAPRLVAGDFNTTPAMGELSRLDGILLRGQPTGGGLYPTSWDARGLGLWRLDYTYHDPAVHLARYRFRDSRGLSDHDAQELWISTTKGSTA
ncbi:endonuclease/exonuclease/phosphatase family protein [Kitasatospora sp. NBC_01539]|uniref:endonuclease/exonuclease/phosphatase family protein n=1 Tax=Kitasatospora sp. NBC_01539 TaxID=2903577 RepID=UPI003860159C